jgi:hypothetical protein
MGYSQEQYDFQRRMRKHHAPSKALLCNFTVVQKYSLRSSNLNFVAGFESAPSNLSIQRGRWELQI